MSMSGSSESEVADDESVAASPDSLIATVSEPMRVSRDSLLNWAKTAGPKELPRLLRRLIGETARIHHVGFPAGTGVAAPEWDGIVECDVGNPFVPEGLSVWELSAGQSNANRKAREDYGKRVKRTPASERSGMVYVAVICAPWTGAEAFAREMSQSREFRRVRAVNVDDLETWLECAPVTTVWLREQMGQPVIGVKLLATWWQSWLASTRIPLGSAIVLAGREDQAEQLRESCVGNEDGKGLVTVGGSVHRDEIVAFAAAALVGGEAETSGVEVLYVDETGTAQRLLAPESPASSRPELRVSALTVVVPCEDFAEFLPAGSRHRMVVPVPGSARADIVLKAVDSQRAIAHMQSDGVGSRLAEESGSLARMSLITLRRRVAVQPELHRPAWAIGQTDKMLRRCLLLHSWDQSNESDRLIVERFVGCSHDDAVEALYGLADGEAPMILTGECWHVVSPEDAWMLLDDKLARTDIVEFGKIACGVLTAPDPLQGLDTAARIGVHMDAMRTGIPPWTGCSSHLKRGIATTLALLGCRPPTPLGAATPELGASASIVNAILRSAIGDESPRTWTAVSEELPLLAEAAPEAVLNGMRACLSEPHAFTQAMFTDRHATTSSPHLRILDALERLAWAPEHLSAAVDVLARLAAIDPGGTWANRPASSLKSIMCPWLPYTTASAEKRSEVIRMLRRNHTSVAWDLMLSMLPRPGETQMPRRWPSYRTWKQAEPTVTNRECAETVTALAEMLVDDVGEDTDRWVRLISHANRLPVNSRSDMIAALSRVVDAGPDEDFKSAVWQTLRQMVTIHRQSSDSPSALPETELAQFDTLLDRLRPAGHTLKYGYLFSQSLLYVDGVKAADGYDAFKKALTAKQAEAVAAILSDSGFSAICEFAERVDNPREVGIALALSDQSLDTDVLTAMNAASVTTTQVALGYFGQRFVAFGWTGVEQLITSCDLSQQVTADLLRAIPPIELPWIRLDTLSNEIASEYWARVTYYDIGHPSDVSQIIRISQQLRNAERLRFAMSIISLYLLSNVSTRTVAEEAAACLDHWIQPQRSQVTVHTDNSAPYANNYLFTNQILTSLINLLDEHREYFGIERLALLEWRYYPILQYVEGFQASNIYRLMSEDPTFFVQLNELAFRSGHISTNGASQQTEVRQQMASDASSVLGMLRPWPDSCFTPGGLDDDGRVDADRLDSWVARAREGLAAVGLSDTGDKTIGTALAASPSDPNGDWPGLAVRDLIERMQNDNIDLGLSVTIRNRRRGSVRSLTEGGAQERKLAEEYREQSQRFSAWPRVAAIFGSLANDYERQGSTEDNRAEAHKRSLPLR